MTQPGGPPFATELEAANAEVEHLDAALQASREIGMAMGIVMERHRLTPDQAFLVLRQMSRNQNLRLREVAATIVYTGETVAP